MCTIYQSIIPKLYYNIATEFKSRVQDFSTREVAVNNDLPAMSAARG